MSVTRINEFHAREGQEEALRALIESFVPIITASEGCHRCDVLQQQDDPAHIIVIEVWGSPDAHQAATKNIPPDALQAAMALLAAPPQGAYFH